MWRIAGVALAVGISAGALADVPLADVPSLADTVPNVGVARDAPASDLTATQIVERNAAARGGLEAWRKIDSMVWSGHIERGGADAQKIPFLMELKRPNKTRFEVKAMSQTAMRVFDGVHGWKQNPSAATGAPEVKSYSADELRFARDAYAIDGPLLDSDAKGIAVKLDGIEVVEGRKAYHLNLRLPSGATQHVWVDAETFLDVKYDRLTQNAAGMTGQVSVMLRDYKSFEGLQIPVIIETAAGGVRAADKMVIEKIALNPLLNDKVFAKPRAPGSGRHSVAVGVGETASPAAPRFPAPAR